ncbi:MAG TPA: xanthine dehydrogenase family protein molybdopterin-binding subunit [Candidatus Sulfotelmatobacter sp.]|nr:xanthine dehydrogenase family protein molybdopterin-binding subunit [Terriglobales bacterium]HKT87987.1 xanthine dehydrogenase family protein molybdopterin-binding subunit [Candidatus Sulfotelmatobacter sp.]
MATDYKWPAADQRTVIGKSMNRVDGPVKSSGRAKYTYDLVRPNMLYAHGVKCPYAHAKVTKIDTSAAEKMPGVAGVVVINDVGKEIFWAGTDVVAVAAVDESTARDAVRAIKVEYEQLPHLVLDEKEPDLSEAEKSEWYKVALKETSGDPTTAFQQAEVVHEGYYGTPVITHCCLETHGSIAEFPDSDHLFMHISTQNVPGIAEQLGKAIDFPASNIHVHQDHVGGGFGSKLGLDPWGVASAQLSKKAGGKPVKMMLDRKPELETAGCRPSARARVKVGAKKDGTLLAWESYSWGSGGVGGGGSPPIPYVWKVPNQQKQHVNVVNNIGPSRAWRAPNHPQACVLTMCPLDDLAAKLNMDTFDFVKKNIDLLDPRSKIYSEELDVADKLMGWKARWHPRGDNTAGPVKQGLGLALHTWGGRGHNSNTDLTIHPDGSVEVKMGTQDIGTGTRTSILQVVSDTLGIPMNQINLLIGDNQYPRDSASGGSSTIGGVSSANFRAATDAKNQLFAKVASALNAQPGDLEAADGRVRVASDHNRSLSWKDACAKLGATSITAHGTNPGEGDLTNSGVGGVQMADVSVDTETGIVKINKMVGVQDCGLVISPTQAKSQVLGAMIMGISYSLYEEKVMDQTTGTMLNTNMDMYRLAGLGDVGELVVHLMSGPGYDERGVIGIGEPPTVSPGAAISNAVANAIGVRVPFLPLTPERVLEALEKAESEGAKA